MGWVVYEKASGHMQKYYKLASTAKSVVTKHNGQPLEPWQRRSNWYREWACCSYRDYEGILMGLRGDEFRVWQFCHKEIG
jgi:hypothetical protein